MRKILRLASIAAAVVLVGGGASALAGQPSPNPCASGTLASGSYGGLTVSGFCKIGFQAQVTVNGNLALADGAVFQGMFIPASLHVTGNVTVGKGALLGLGYGTSAVVDGNITANQPLSVYLGNMTVHGNVVSNGGGTAARFYNFPIKDNTIGGNLILHGWQGGWIGALRNIVGGNVDVSNNTSVVQSECPGTFPNGCDPSPGALADSSEVTDNTVGGNLICRNNLPAAQFGDSGGGPNTVSGNKIGECAGL